MRRPRTVSGLAALAITVAGCSDTVAGSAERPDVAGPPAIVGAVSSPMLDRLPANGSTLADIALIDPAALTKVASHRGYSADPGSGTDRPEAQTAWLDQVAVSNPCGRVLDASYNSLRAGDAGASSSLVLGTEQKNGTLAACAGAAPDPAKLRSSKIRGDGVAARTVAGIAGYVADDVWIGVDAKQSLTYLIDGEGLPEDLAQQAISGQPVESSLADDARVRAVLDAAPGAAMLEMGTDLVTSSPSAAPKAVGTAFQQAVAQGGFQQAPVPEFGGYAWVPGRRLTGTAVFVTVYGSPQDAATTVKILADTWSRLDPSKFSGAHTEQRDVVVITTLADVAPTEFKVQNGALPEYPGFLGGR